MNDDGGQYYTQNNFLSQGFQTCVFFSEAIEGKSCSGQRRYCWPCLGLGCQCYLTTQATGRTQKAETNLGRLIADKIRITSEHSLLTLSYWPGTEHCIHSGWKLLKWGPYCSSWANSGKSLDTFILNAAFVIFYRPVRVEIVNIMTSLLLLFTTHKSYPLISCWPTVLSLLLWLAVSLRTPL